MRLRQERGRLLQKIRGLEQNQERKKQEVRGLRDMGLGLSLQQVPFWGYPTSSPSPYTRASSVFLQHSRHGAAPRPLHVLWPLPETPFPRCPYDSLPHLLQVFAQRHLPYPDYLKLLHPNSLHSSLYFYSKHLLLLDVPYILFIFTHSTVSPRGQTWLMVPGSQ